MLFHTHILLGIALFLFIEPFLGSGNSVVFFLLVLLGSVIPDIDSARSKVNKWSGIIGLFVVFCFKHRGLFHSLLFHAGLFVIVWKTVGVYYASGLFLGYVAHVIGDGITPMGVRVLWPLKCRVRGPIRVGGFIEGLVFVALVIVVLLKVFG